MNKILDFSYNWNNKLDCRFFTTIRRSARFEVGDVVEVFLGADRLGEVEIKGKKHLTIATLNDWIAGVDTGYSVEETVKILKRMYADLNDATPLFFYLCRYTDQTFVELKKSAKARKKEVKNEN